MNLVFTEHSKFMLGDALLKIVQYILYCSLVIVAYNVLVSGPAKWILKWRSHGTLQSIVGHHGWQTRKNFEF